MVNQRFREAVWVALASLRTSKLRSFLTLLGIILATTTLIAVMSLIHGMDVYIAEKVSDMGADGFRVERMAFFGDFDPKKYLEFLRKNPELRRDEYEFIKSKATMVKEIAIYVERMGPVVADGDRVDGVAIQGVSASYAAIEDTQIESGRYISEVDDQRHLMVVVLGHDFKDRWFPNVDAVGKVVQVDGRPYEVIGVAKAKGSVFGMSRDNFVAMPAETYFKSYGARKGISYAVMAAGHDKFQQAQEEVRVLIRSYRRLLPGQEDNFAVFSSETIANAWNQMTAAIAATAIGVVSVFMVVGGVVIMNIMLAVVSERTQEIGIRKSLGARRSDILNQFLVESSVLAASGGLFGVGIAWVFAVAIRNLTPVPMEMPMMSVALGVGLSMTVGLFFGIYPARRASKLDPIEALRVER
ncbi:MAG: FtsX-like permease family protein [Acidobacteria bacterium]|nr:FtsX-like permease family protein [Acidobacteriota bacterium]